MSSFEKLGDALGQIPTGTSPFTTDQEETLRRAQSEADLRAVLAADDTLRPALRAAFEIKAFRTALADDHAKLVALVGEAATPPDARRFAPSATAFTGVPTPGSPELVSLKPVRPEEIRITGWEPAWDERFPPMAVRLADAEGLEHFIILERREKGEARRLLREQNYPDNYRDHLKVPDVPRYIIFARSLSGEILGYQVTGEWPTRGNYMAIRTHKKSHVRNSPPNIKGLSWAMTAFLLTSLRQDWGSKTDDEDILTGIKAAVVRGLRKVALEGRSPPEISEEHVDEDQPVSLTRKEAAFILSRFAFTAVPDARRLVDFPYEVVTSSTPNGHVVIYVRGAPDERAMADHVLAKTLIERGYTLYSYRIPKTPDWKSYDEGKSFTEDLEKFVALVRRENPEAAIHLIGNSMGAVAVRRYLEEHGEEIASAVFEVPAFENHAMVFHFRRARGKYTPPTLYPRTGKPISTPSFWLFADQDVVVNNHRARHDRADFFTGPNEELTVLDADHFPYRGGNPRFAVEIANWLDRQVNLVTPPSPPRDDNSPQPPLRSRGGEGELQPVEMTAPDAELRSQLEALAFNFALETDLLSRIGENPFQPVPDDMMERIVAAVIAKIGEVGRAMILLGGIQDPQLHERVVEQLSRRLTSLGYQESRRHGGSLSVTTTPDDLGPQRASRDFRRQLASGIRRQTILLTYTPPQNPPARETPKGPGSGAEGAGTLPALAELESLWKASDERVAALAVADRIAFLRRVDFGFIDGFVAEGDRTSLTPGLPAEQAEYWGGEEAFRYLQNLHTVSLRDRHHSSREVKSVLEAARSRWERQYWTTRRQHFLEEHQASSHLALLGIDHPEKQVITLFHVGTYPRGLYSASLPEGAWYGHRAERRESDIWAIDVPFDRLEQVMGGSLSPDGRWLSPCIQPSGDLDLIAYGLRHIGTVDINAVVRFADPRGDDVVVYGNIKRLRDEYLSVSDHARRHGGEIPEYAQRTLRIPSGSRWQFAGGLLHAKMAIGIADMAEFTPPSPRQGSGPDIGQVAVAAARISSSPAPTPAATGVDPSQDSTPGAPPTDERLTMIARARAWMPETKGEGYGQSEESLRQVLETDGGAAFLKKHADDLVAHAERLAGEDAAGWKIQDLAMAHIMYRLIDNPEGLRRIAELRLQSLRPIIALLDEEKIPHALVGGMALSLLQPHWFSWDIDLLVSMNAEQVTRLMERLRTAPFEIHRVAPETGPEPAVPDIIQFSRNGLEFDLMNANNDFKVQELQRAKPVEGDGGTIRVITPEDQLLGMLLGNRPTNEQKIPMLLEALQVFDWAYFSAWVKKMDLESEWDATRKTLARYSSPTTDSRAPASAEAMGSGPDHGPAPTRVPGDGDLESHLVERVTTRPISPLELAVFGEIVRMRPATAVLPKDKTQLTAILASIAEYMVERGLVNMALQFLNAALSTLPETVPHREALLAEWKVKRARWKRWSDQIAAGEASFKETQKKERSRKKTKSARRYAEAAQTLAAVAREVDREGLPFLVHQIMHAHYLEAALEAALRVYPGTGSPFGPAEGGVGFEEEMQRLHRKSHEEIFWSPVGYDAMPSDSNVVVPEGAQIRDQILLAQKLCGFRWGHDNDVRLLAQTETIEVGGKRDQERMSRILMMKKIAEEVGECRAALSQLSGDPRRMIEAQKHLDAAQRLMRTSFGEAAPDFLKTLVSEMALFLGKHSGVGSGPDMGQVAVAAARISSSPAPTPAAAGVDPSQDSTPGAPPVDAKIELVMDEYEVLLDRLDEVRERAAERLKQHLSAGTLTQENRDEILKPVLEALDRVSHHLQQSKALDADIPKGQETMAMRALSQARHDFKNEEIALVYCIRELKHFVFEEKPTEEQKGEMTSRIDKRLAPKKNLASILEAAARTQVSLSREHKVQVSIDLPVELQGSMTRDIPTRRTLMRALVNPVSNSIKYFNPLVVEGERYVRLSVRQEGKSLIFAIEDNGRGMNQVDADTKFGTGWRDPAVLAEKIPGSGVGSGSFLDRIRELGGEFLGIQTAPGQGTTVRFSIPLTVFETALGSGPFTGQVVEAVPPATNVPVAAPAVEALAGTSDLSTGGEPRQIVPDQGVASVPGTTDLPPFSVLALSYRTSPISVASDLEETKSPLDLRELIHLAAPFLEMDSSNGGQFFTALQQHCWAVQKGDRGSEGINKQMMAHWIGRTEPELWRAVVAKAEASLAKAPETFPAVDEGDVNKAGRTLRQIALAAVEGNRDALQCLVEEAASGKEMARVAQFFLKHWPVLQKMGKSQDRLEFGKMAEALFQGENHRIIQGLLEGSLQPDARLALQIKALDNGVLRFMIYLDDEKRKQIPSWRSNPEANGLMHGFENGIRSLRDGALFLGEGGTIGPITFAHLTAKKDTHPFDLQNLVRTAVVRVAFGAAAKNIKIEIKVPAGTIIPEDKVDKFLVGLTELLQNAVKYADGEKGEKWIRITFDKERQVLTVADNGIGIADIPAAWGGRRQAPGKEGEESEGLPTVRRNLDETGIRVQLLSSPGKGTLFVLSLPSSGEEQSSKDLPKDDIVEATARDLLGPIQTLREELDETAFGQKLTSLVKNEYRAVWLQIVKKSADLHLDSRIQMLAAFHAWFTRLVESIVVENRQINFLWDFSDDANPDMGIALRLLRRRTGILGKWLKGKTILEPALTGILDRPEDFYETDFLEARLAAERTFVAGNGHFNVETLVGEVATLMTPDEQLRLTKQLFDEWDRRAEKLVKAVEALPEGDIEGLARLELDWTRALYALSGLVPASDSMPVSSLIRELKSSMAQLPLGLGALLHSSLMELREKRTTWGQVRESFREAHIYRGEGRTGERNYQVSHARRELSQTMTSWLSSHSPSTQGWEGSVWVLSFSKTSEQGPMSHSNLARSPWPPTPETDLVLKTFLEVLGWTLTVEEADENFVVRVDFGANAVEPGGDNGPKVSPAAASAETVADSTLVPEPELTSLKRIRPDEIRITGWEPAGDEQFPPQAVRLERKIGEEVVVVIEKRSAQEAKTILTQQQYPDDYEDFLEYFEQKDPFEVFLARGLDGEVLGYLIVKLKNSSQPKLFVSAPLFGQRAHVKNHDSHDPKKINGLFWAMMAYVLSHTRPLWESEDTAGVIDGINREVLIRMRSKPIGGVRSPVTVIPIFNSDLLDRREAPFILSRFAFTPVPNPHSLASDGADRETLSATTDPPAPATVAAAAESDVLSPEKVLLAELRRQGAPDRFIESAERVIEWTSRGEAPLAGDAHVMDEAAHWLKSIDEPVYTLSQPEFVGRVRYEMPDGSRMEFSLLDFDGLLVMIRFENGRRATVYVIRPEYHKRAYQLIPPPEKNVVHRDPYRLTTIGFHMDEIGIWPGDVGADLPDTPDELDGPLDAWKFFVLGGNENHLRELGYEGLPPKPVPLGEHPEKKGLYFWKWSQPDRQLDPAFDERKRVGGETARLLDLLVNYDAPEELKQAVFRILFKEATGEALSDGDRENLETASAWVDSVRLERTDGLGYRFRKEASPLLASQARGEVPADDLLVVVFPTEVSPRDPIAASLHEQYVRGMREAAEAGIAGLVLRERHWNGRSLIPYATAMVASRMGEFAPQARTNRATFAGGSFREGIGRAVRSFAHTAFTRGERVVTARLVADAIWTYEGYQTRVDGKDVPHAKQISLKNLLGNLGGEKEVVRMIRRWLDWPVEDWLSLDARVVLIWNGKEFVVQEGNGRQTLRLKIVDGFPFEKDPKARAMERMRRALAAPVPLTTSHPVSVPTEGKTPTPPKKPGPPQHRPEGIPGARTWSEALEMRRGFASPRAVRSSSFPLRDNFALPSFDGRGLRGGWPQDHPHPGPLPSRERGENLRDHVTHLALERGLKKSAGIAARLSDKALAALAQRDRLEKILARTGFGWAKNGLGPWGRRIAPSDLLLLGLAALARSDQEVAAALQKISPYPDNAIGAAISPTQAVLPTLLPGARSLPVMPIGR